MSTARFQTYSGSCEITENQVRLTKSRVTASLRRIVQRNPKASRLVVLLTVFLFVGALIETGSIFEGLLFISKFVLAPTIVIYVVGQLLVFAYREILKRRHGISKGDVIFSGTISRDRIVSVKSVEAERGSGIVIDFKQDGVMRSGIMRFVTEENFKQAKSSFEKAGIPINDA